jgi:hypothetical protein
VATHCPVFLFYEDMLFAYSRRLFNGASETEFSPSAPMTRRMIVTALHRLASEPAAGGANAFSDAESGKYYDDAILRATSEGIISGYGNGLFGPDGNSCASLWRCCSCATRIARV